MSTSIESPICFSPISTIRCHGLTKLQYIGMFTVAIANCDNPIKLIFCIVNRGSSLYTKWDSDTAITCDIDCNLEDTEIQVEEAKLIFHRTLILLTIEISLYVIITSWDFIIDLVSIDDLNTFKVEDMILAIISSTSNLFLLLTLTSYILSIQRSLPSSFQSKNALIIFGTIISTLIPVSLISNIVTSFLPLDYYKSKNGEIITRFSMISNKKYFELLIKFSSISSMVYISILTLLILMTRKKDKERSKEERKSKYVLIFGLVFVIIEFGLSMVENQEFGWILNQRIIHSISRISLVFGLIQIYRLNYHPKYIAKTNPNVGKVKRNTRGESKFKGRDTITTFDIPPTPSHYFINDTYNNPVPQRSNTNITRKSLKKVKKVQIGNPVEGTFKKVNIGLDRDYYDLRSHVKFGLGMMGDQMATLGSPMSSERSRGEKVVVRAPNKRPPILSFTPSTFTQSSLDALASSIPRTRQSRIYNETSQIQNDTRNRNIPSTSNSSSAKKNIGSIYSPNRISVNPNDLAIWPPHILIDRNNHYSYRPYKDGHTNSGLSYGNVGEKVDYSNGSYSNMSNLRDNPLDFSERFQGNNHIEQLGENPNKPTTRVRSGTSTERGIWFNPSLLQPQSGQDNLTRPSLVYRKSTDPSEAIYPSPTASSTLEGSSTPIQRGQEINEQNQNQSQLEIINQNQRDDQKHLSLNSIYTNTQTIHSSNSQSISTTRNLFYITPVQSPSPPLFSNRCSMPEICNESSTNLSNIQYSDSNSSLCPNRQLYQDRKQNEDQDQPASPSPFTDNNQISSSSSSPSSSNKPINTSTDHKLRQSELQTVLESLNKLRRETGFSGNFDFEDSTIPEGSERDERDSFVIPSRKPWNRNNEYRISSSEISTVTFNSESYDDLTPVAEIHLVNTGRRNFGGVI